MDASRTISLRYNETLAYANQLEELAISLEQMAERAKSDLELLGSIWAGETALKYREKLMREESLIRCRAGELHAAADALRNAARKTYAAEMYALSLRGG